MEVIQSLWSGYGKISRYQLDSTQHPTVVVKFISLNQPQSHPRGWNTSNSHNRKVKSYQVETSWYQKWGQQCTESCKIPNLIGSFSEGQDQWIILEDLNHHYPLRKQQITLREVKVCLKWLANFHATFMEQKPVDLWEIGTYWHLDTRPDEFQKMNHPKLQAHAKQIDERLNQCQYQTFVHGDAKLANFCFSENGQQVAAVDFQYVGGGCGMKDVSYFLGSCLSSNECAHYEKELLDEYFSQLQEALQARSSSIDFDSLLSEWREMYLFACTDFMRFLLGWLPSHQKINRYNLNIMNQVLASL